MVRRCWEAGYRILVTGYKSVASTIRFRQIIAGSIEFLYHVASNPFFCLLCIQLFAFCF